jgi:DNA mismatch repair protein MutS2
VPIVRPRDLEVLGFPKVLDALAALAVSRAGAEACRSLRPVFDRAAAARPPDPQWSLLRLVEIHGALPLAEFPDVREALSLAAHDGAVLPGERLAEVRTVLRRIHTLKRFLRGPAADFPVLADLPARLPALPELEAALERTLDDAGGLRDDASPRLAELRAALRDLRQEIEERLERLVTAGGAAEGIADRYVTVRNNRFVVPIKAGAAGRLAGVVQDRSASGETLFVEPLFAIELNNRLLLARKEEEQEELRLLALLTAQVGAARDALAAGFLALAEIDRLAAGASLARRLRCTRPALGDDRIDLRGARHPELLLAGHAVTPVDVRLSEGKRALVVSGPNTGGKTVALKTLGLLTALAHAGVLVPADEGSAVPLVTAVLADLADDQSIERNLSTFSSHVANLVDIFGSARPPALVLLDEPGAGTDPEEGAALAVGLVAGLMDAGCLVAAATHYAPVKLWALGEARVDVAAVEVDPSTFEPRYRLLYGSLGESLGLAMARRLGLPAGVLEAAEARRSAAARELAGGIERLERSRRRLEDERRAVAEERRALAELEDERMRLVAELRERRRARWAAELEEARAFVRTLKAEGRALLETARRRPSDAGRDLTAFGRRAEEAIATRAAALAEPGPAVDRPPAVGEEVEVRGTRIRGELVELARDSARLRRGAVTFQVPAAELRRIGGEPGPAPPRVAHGRATATEAPAATELRLIGLRVPEALERLERFLDRAQETGVTAVRIVHGVGTGALKRAIGEYLAASPYCTGFRDAEPSQGGAGVTVAALG